MMLLSIDLTIACYPELCSWVQWNPTSSKGETEKKVRMAQQKTKPERFEAYGRVDTGSEGKDPTNREYGGTGSCRWTLLTVVSQPQGSRYVPPPE